jgi:hypothetical protein
MNYITVGPMGSKTFYRLIKLLKERGFILNKVLMKGSLPKYVFIGGCSIIPEYVPSHKIYPAKSILNGDINPKLEIMREQKKYVFSY